LKIIKEGKYRVYKIIDNKYKPIGIIYTNTEDANIISEQIQKKFKIKDFIAKLEDK